MGLHARTAVRLLSIILVVVSTLPGCTLTVTAPLDPPANHWDPGLNTHPRGAAFQQALEQHVADGLPGVVLYVSTPEGIWCGGSGYARVESGTPMLPTHLHHTASVTKMYTAAAVMRMVEEGAIDLDAKIEDLLPAGALRGIPNAGEATVRHLLGHTSGIPDFSGSLRYELDTLNDPMGRYPPGRMLSYLRGQSRIFPAGTGYFYSNANYLLLALILDHATDSGHAEIISQQVLAPLDLSDTFYKNEPEYPRPPGLVNSYQDLTGAGQLVNGSDLAVHDAEESMGYAGVIATASDLARFLDGLLDGGLLTQATIEEMLTPTESERYGLGLSLMETPYGLAVGHSGGSFGVQAQVRRFPEREATLVLLSNGGDAGVPKRLFLRLWQEVTALAFPGF